MNTLLLTGFEPFLNFSINPTEEIVKELDGQVIGSFKIIGKVLPVDFINAGNELLNLFDTYNPSAVVSLGLAGGRSKITPERIAINCNDGAADNKGNKYVNAKIDLEGPDGLFSTLPIQKIVDVLNEHHLPAEISNSAGAYLCNNVMYQMLNELQKLRKQIPSGFIHIPASHELAVIDQKLPSWSQRDLTDAIKLAIEVISHND
ncbi:pyroglutamyl-peptidase I [Bacillus sp. AFS017336]|uniref:pyroglutamyl-peptidase I n=1 Tax=Bacillus sp. AFS017336 TaxID=2033489 RepID=UPI000BF1AC48|nr:pyroglutamyl-peptidase I [Bacillus sp. AFS017336]PEL07778.1 peptidase C15 [Bacillus sp. AFS017336]